MNQQFSIIQGHGQISGLLALGFYGIGLVCLVVLLGLITASPIVLTGDPYQMNALGLAALGLLGFTASFIFGTYYAVSSLLSGSGLWSRKMASGHFLLHTTAIIWLVACFGGMEFLDQPFQGLVIGGMLFLFGVLLMIFNMVATASRLNLWEPSQITVVSSLFWLGLASLFLLGLVVEQFHPFMSHGPIQLLEIHTLLALAGFLWLGLLGSTLKMLVMFSVSQKSPGTLSWIGCVMMNTVLMLMVPVLLASPSWAVPSIASALFLGSAFYIADILRILAGSRKKIQSGIIASLTGLFVGLLVLLWLALGNQPLFGDDALTVDAVRRIVTVVVIFGIALPIFLGTGIRMVPFLIWRIRCMPYVGKYQQPALNTLHYPSSAFVSAICLLVGVAYLIAGQLAANGVGTQLGAITTLVGVWWFVHALYPAGKGFLLGVEPQPDSHEKHSR